MHVRLEGKLGKYKTSVIDLKGVYKLVVLLPKAGRLRAKLAEVSPPFFCFHHYHTC